MFCVCNYVNPGYHFSINKYFLFFNGFCCIRIQPTFCKDTDPANFIYGSGSRELIRIRIQGIDTDSTDPDQGN